MGTSKAAVDQLSKDGVLLAEIIFSGSYSQEVRDEALRRLRWNVAGFHTYKREVD